MNTTIDTYLNALRKTLGHMEAGERDAVMAEIEDHLTQECARLQNEQELTEKQAARQALEAFGPAKEIGVAYGGGARDTLGIINQATGERLLEVATLTGKVAGKVAVVGGRGLKGVLKLAGIATLSILCVVTVLTVAGMILAGTLATVFQDDIRESVPRPLYDNHQRYSGTDAETTTFTESFEVRSDVKEFWIDLHANADGGCTTIRLLDPAGAVRYDSGDVCGDTDKHRQLTALSTEGTWIVEYQFIAFTGYVDVEAMYFQKADSSGA